MNHSTELTTQRVQMIDPVLADRVVWVRGAGLVSLAPRAIYRRPANQLRAQRSSLLTDHYYSYASASIGSLRAAIQAG